MSRRRLSALAWLVATVRLRGLARLRELRARVGSTPIAAAVVPTPRRLRRDEPSLRLSHVLVSSDLNPRYLDCWPLARRAWREVAALEAVLVLVARHDDVPAELVHDPGVHVFEPLEELHVSLQAQCIRLLYPALLDADHGVLTADVDMVPLAREYFHRWPARIAASHFLAYRDVLLRGHEIPICYTAALPRTWSDVFAVQTVADVRTRLREWAADVVYDGVPGGRGWDTDQVMLYRTLVARGRERNDVWILDDRFTGINRLDGRILAGSEPDESIERRIARGAYTDYHLLQPLAEHRHVNERVVEIAARAAARSVR